MDFKSVEVLTDSYESFLRTNSFPYPIQQTKIFAFKLLHSKRYTHKLFCTYNIFFLLFFCDVVSFVRDLVVKNRKSWALMHGLTTYIYNIQNISFKIQFRFIFNVVANTKGTCFHIIILVILLNNLLHLSIETLYYNYLIVIVITIIMIVVNNIVVIISSYSMTTLW